MLDYEKIFTEATTRRIRDSQLAELSGLTRSRLSIIRNGAAQMTGSEFRRLRELLDDLTALEINAGGAPLNYRDTTTIKIMLAKLRSDRNAPPPKEPTEIDRDIFQRFSHSEDLSEIALRFGLDKITVLSRVENVLKYTEHLVRTSQQA